MSTAYEGELQHALESLDEQSTGEAGAAPEFEWETQAMNEALLRPMRRVRIPAHLLATVNRHREQYQRLMRGVAAMHRHISLRNGQLHFTLPARSSAEAAAKLGMSPGLFAHLHASVKAGHVHARRFSVVARPPTGLARIVSAEMEFESGGSCAGATKVATHWWGVQLYLDECKTGALVPALKGGGVGAGAICGLLGLATEGVAWAICGILAALGQAAGFLVETVDNSGGKQGVVLTWTWAQVALPVVPLPVVTSQGW